MHAVNMMKDFHKPLNLPDDRSAHIARATEGIDINQGNERRSGHSRLVYDKETHSLVCEGGFTVSLILSDGQTPVDSYTKFERATWNFGEAILKPYVNEARITTDFGRTTLARWRRPNAPSPTPEAS